MYAICAYIGEAWGVNGAAYMLYMECLGLVKASHGYVDGYAAAISAIHVGPWMRNQGLEPGFRRKYGGCAPENHLHWSPVTSLGMGGLSGLSEAIWHNSWLEFHVAILMQIHTVCHIDFGILAPRVLSRSTLTTSHLCLALYRV